MKLKNSEIVNFLNMNLKQKKLPVKVAFAIKLNSDKMQSAATAYNEAMVDLRKEHSVKEGEPIPEHFIRSVNELLEITTDVNIDTVTMEDVEKTELPEFDTLTVDEIEAIYFMIS